MYIYHAKDRTKYRYINTECNVQAHVSYVAMYIVTREQKEYTYMCVYTVDACKDSICAFTGVYSLQPYSSTGVCLQAK